MKLKSLVIPSLLIILLSCNFSKGVKKDMVTGLSASYTGLSLEDIYLSDQSDNRLGSNKINLGSHIKIVAEQVQNLTVQNGLVFPGCQIILTDKTGKEILNLPDAFSEYDNGIAREQATVLKATLTTGDPMKSGETYHFSARFFDKKKIGNQIKADIALLMQ